jgi:hypothetical protein
VDVLAKLRPEGQITPEDYPSKGQKKPGSSYEKPGDGRFFAGIVVVLSGNFEGAEEVMRAARIRRDDENQGAVESDKLGSYMAIFHRTASDRSPGIFCAKDLAGLDAIATARTGIQDYAVFEYAIRSELNGVKIAVETSSNLATWTSPGEIVFLEQVDHRDGTLTVRCRTSNPVAPGDRPPFARVRVLFLGS